MPLDADKRGAARQNNCGQRGGNKLGAGGPPDKEEDSYL